MADPELCVLLNNRNSVGKASPYTSEEKKLLTQLIKQHPVIVSKKLDALTLGRKHLAWEKVKNKYNAQTTESRTVQQLKKCWDKIKMAAMKTKLYNTDVIPKVEPEDTIIYEPEYNEAAPPVNPIHVSMEPTEVPNSFDSDGLYSQGVHETYDCVYLTPDHNDHQSEADSESLPTPDIDMSQNMCCNPPTQTDFLKNEYSRTKQINDSSRHISSLGESELIKMKYTKIFQNLEEEIEMKRIEHRMKMEILGIQLRNVTENK